MMHQQEHAHAEAQRNGAASSDAVGSGRDNASAKLRAPTHPIASGLLQRKARDANGVEAGAEDAVAAAASSSGSSLPTTIMRKFEDSLGTDLSSVRVHTGAESATAASSVGAKAYTVGQDIHFAAGQYDPSSSSGQHLLAHEVAHTVQQRGGTPTRQNKLEVSSPFDAAEAEADRAADAMVSGGQASIAGAPVSHARMIQREKDEKAGGGEKHEAKPGEGLHYKGTFDLPEKKLWKSKYKYVEFESSVRGKVTAEVGTMTAKGQLDEAASVAGPGGSVKGGGVAYEGTMAQSEAKDVVWGMELDEKVEDKLNFTLTKEKLEVSVSHEVRASSKKAPWLKGGGDIKLVGVSVDWEKLQKNPDAAEFAAIDVALALGGEGTLAVPWSDQGLKLGIEGSIGAKAQPNWGQIAAEVGKEVAKQGAKQGAKAAGETAVTGSSSAAAATGAEAALVMDSAAVGSAAAAVILPLAVGALMIAGAFQEEKNTNASRAAIAYGLKLRTEGRAYAKGYADMLAGHAASGQGAADANALILQAMAATKKTREEAGAELLQKGGGYGKVAADIYHHMQGILYDRGVATFEEKYKDQFGLVEKLGETWGMRGTFRKDFYRMLYADE